LIFITGENLMRHLIIVGVLLSFLLTGCAFLTPHTSKALSDSSQLEELKEQTKQIKQQTEALERLADTTEKLIAPQVSP
jgi:outer membrane biogenesis lipoprotein LolB